MIKNTGDNPEYTTGSKRENKEGKGRMDLLPACALIRLSKHYEEGAKIYGDRNWEKGQPIHQYIDSALRHICNYLDGAIDEDHLCAATWNLMGAMWTEEKIPEMQDIPSRIKKADVFLIGVDLAVSEHASGD